MIWDYETAKLIGLAALFVVLVVAAVVTAARDSRRQRKERERRIRQQVELLKRARAEAERQRRLEALAGPGAPESGDYRPSEFAISGLARLPPTGAGPAAAVRDTDGPARGPV